MPSLGPMELVLILLIVVLLFGAGKIPEIGGAVGKSIREFRSSVKTDEDNPTAKAAKDSAEPLAEKKEA